MYTEISHFEWHSHKAQNNFHKHGIRFQETATAFDDPFGMIDEDIGHSQDEKRLQLLGESANGRLLIIIFTIRFGPAIRVISARPANRQERAVYAFKRFFSVS